MPRPYAVLPDDKITAGELTWPDEGGSGDTVTSYYASEWERYTDVEYNGMVEQIQGQQGQMILRRGDASAPNGYTFPGMPTMRVARAVVLVRWYQVPYRYVDSTNSFIQKYQGKINQNVWRGNPVGSLLYDSYRCKRYTPPFPNAEALESGGLAFTADKMCDIEFTFLKVMRTTPSAPTPSNTNWKAAGHNLLPWFGDRKFYYAVAQNASTSLQVPPYLSFPFELLFSDPDYTPDP